MIVSEGDPVYWELVKTVADWEWSQSDISTSSAIASARCFTIASADPIPDRFPCGRPKPDCHGTF